MKFKLSKNKIKKSIGIVATGGACLVLASEFYSSLSFTPPQHMVLMGGYIVGVLFINPVFSRIQNSFLDKISLEPFKTLYKTKNKFVYKNYAFNKRAMLVDLLVSSFGRTMAVFLFWKALMVGFFDIPGRNSGELKKWGWISAQNFAMITAVKILAGIVYNKTQEVPPWYQLALLLISIRFQAQLMALASGTLK